MIFLFLLLVLIIAAIIANRVSSEWERGPNTFGTVLLGIAFVALLYSKFNEVYKQVDTTTMNNINIVSLTADNRTSGSFALGCGSIENIEYYFYYYQREDGNYVRGQKRLNKSSIRQLPEDSDEIPHIEWTELTYINPAWVGPNFGHTLKTEFIFVVPFGTMVQRFVP